MMHAHASIKKHGRRWHWTITVRSAAGQGHVYQGVEATWRLAWAMMEFAWLCHKMEWTVPHQIKQGVISAIERVDGLRHRMVG